MGALELVDWPSDRIVALSGPTEALRLPLAVRNTSGDPIQLAEASLSEVRHVGSKTSLRVEPVPVQISLAANGVTRAQVRLRLAASTPPGRYEGQVELAGQSRSLTIDILPQVKLNIRPDAVVLDAADGSQQSVAVGFDNRGNVPLTIDLAGAYPLGEEIAIAPDRLKGEAIAGGSMAAIFDRVIGREPAPALRSFGVLDLRMPDGPIVLQPGETGAAKVAVKLPGNLSPTARYHLFAPLYAADLHIIIVTAVKPSIPARAARRSKGASA